ncbi:hypothetical protein PROFUN_03635 [Planoprotostelium fungivorum]|uniref:Uncharacterized protein n=1 Tax=Planoprotostelium fungivorum TaxID=1890364 RepID=A0A2P6NSE9_9EUKA|nr:hypothetical protein PROFUN_03635 [Planoprotostelium fungivorum]
MSDTIRIGYYIPAKKLAKMTSFPQLAEELKQYNAELVSLDIGAPLEEQAKGLHLILNKVTDELTPGQEDTQRIKSFESFLLANPQIKVIDPIKNQRKVMDRQIISGVLSELEQKLDKSLNFRMPKHKVFEKREDKYDITGFKFPLICKTTVACGSAETHMMGVVFEESGLQAFEPPFLAQEFYNHNSTIYKVFTVGDHVSVVKRMSLPNMPSDHRDTVFFDSQKPFAEQMKALKRSSDKTDEQFVEDAEIPPMERIRGLSEGISQSLGLTLFGFDVITRVEDGVHAAVDVNYFPSFGGVKDFWKILAKFLVEQVKEGKQEFLQRFHLTRFLSVQTVKKWKELSNYALKITWRQIRKNKINFGLGFCACLVVVIVICILLTLLANTPIVFLRLSEMQAGEYDYIVKAQGAGNRLNYTLMWDQTKGGEHQYSAPRIEIDGITIFSAASCDQEALEKDREGDFRWRYAGLPSMGRQSCAATHECLVHFCKRQSTGKLVLIDSVKEKNMGLGRTWDLPDLTKGQMHMTADISNELGLSSNSGVFFHFDSYDLFSKIAWDKIFGNHTSEGANHYDIFSSATLISTFDTPMGKFADDMSRTVVMDINTFVEHTYNQVDTRTLPIIVDRYKAEDLLQLTSDVLFNIPPDSRMKYYINSDYDQVQKAVAGFGANLAYKIGFNVVDMSTPILPKLFAFRFLAIFLGLIFNVIITVLLFICIILIYSLLSTTLEARSFETAVHRMFGMDASKIIMLLLLQGLCYSLPSLPVGIIFAQIVAFASIRSFGSYIGVQLSPTLTGSSVLWSAIITFTIPLIASAIPIRKVLTESLITSLAPTSSKTKAVEISIERSEFSAFSWPWAIVGGALTIFGVAIYYLLPYSLLSLNLQLLLNLFVVLLLGMLFGMSTFTLNLQTMGERVLVHILFFWEKRGIRALVLKNLVAHRISNRQTAALYSVSIAFICFILVSYNLQINTLLYQIQKQRGTFISINFVNQNWASVAELEDTVNQYPNIIQDYAWRSVGLEKANSATTLAMNLGKTFSSPVWVTAISPNYFDVSIPGFLSLNEYRENVDPLWNLYTPKGSHSALVGTLYKKNMGFHLPTDENDRDADFLIQVTTQQGTKSYHRIRPIGFVDSAPGLVMSPFPVIIKQDILVSVPTFLRMWGNHTSMLDMDTVPLRVINLKLKEGTTDEEKNALIKGLNSRLQGRIWVWDYRKQIEPISIATTIVAWFFNVTTAMAMIVCFFSLNSTMFNSIYSQVKEISILRALGVTKFWMYRIYIYEAVVLVLLSSLFGLGVGTFIGYTMTIQGTLFTQLPVPFVFPTSVLIIVLIASMVLSVAASFGPTRHLLKMSVVTLMKYTQLNMEEGSSSKSSPTSHKSKSSGSTRSSRTGASEAKPETVHRRIEKAREAQEAAKAVGNSVTSSGNDSSPATNTGASTGRTKMSSKFTALLPKDADVFSLRWSPDQKLLACGCADGQIRVYGSSGRVSYTLGLSSISLPTTCVRFRPSSPNHKTKNILIAANSDGTLRHWHVTSEKCVHTITEEDNQIYAVDYRHDAERFSTAGKDFKIRLYDEQTKQRIATLTGGTGDSTAGHANRVFSLKFSPSDDNIIVSGGWDNTVQIWDIRTNHSIRSIFGPHICGDAVDVWNNLVLTGSWRANKPLQLWDFTSGELIQSYEWNQGLDSESCLLYGVQFSKNNNASHIAAAGSGSNMTKVFDRHTGKIVGEYVERRGVYTLDWTEDSKQLAIGGCEVVGDGPFEDWSIMDEQRRILDALMGTSRNGDAEDKKDFTDPDVCKFFLVGFCPVELFINTKMDVGECKKIHQESLKMDYEEASKKREYGYEQDLIRELESIVHDCDRKINNARKRLEHNQEVEKQLSGETEADDLGPEIEKLIKKAEELGEEGEVDESLKVMEQVNNLKAQQQADKARRQAMTTPPAIPALEIGPLSNQQQKLRVCDVCAALLSIIDSDKRLADHFGGRLHHGYVKVREKLEQLKKNRKPERPSYRDDNRERDRQRDRERVAQDRDRDYNDRDRQRDRERYEGETITGETITGEEEETIVTTTGETRQEVQATPMYAAIAQLGERIRQVWATSTNKNMKMPEGS